MNKNTSPAAKTSKQRQDEMYARLAAAEARIEANHKRYLAIMKHYDEMGR